ncbi:ThiF family adenylyltransferase [Chloroflexota bacterium]
MIEKSLRDRYSRQTVFPRIGDAGQEKLLGSYAVVIGCGALGCNIASFLVRAGVGKVRIVDRDFPETHNLQRQTLFDEEDIRAGLSKAVAAQRHLNKINSTIKIEGIVADFNFSNAEDLCHGADVILDGLDNADTRFLLNDVALKNNIPWVYGGAIGAAGMTMNIIPGRTPCFRCIFPSSPAPGTTPTCETAGIVGTTPAVVGAIQATEAMKILMGDKDISLDMLLLDVWAGTCEHIKVKPREGCPACGGSYDFLAAKFTSKASSLCGQSRAIQVVDTTVGGLVLEELAVLLEGVSNVSLAEDMLRFEAEDFQITVFPDGRAIIYNTVDEAQAKSIYEKYIARFINSA